MHSARRAGRAPPLAALRRLLAHHSSPAYREISHMGKKPVWGRGGGRGQGQSSSGYGASHGWATAGGWDSEEAWRYWKGAWSPRSRDKELRYDQVVLRPQGQETATGSGVEGGFLNGIQKALTQAKKHDARVRKLQEERQLRQQQFAQFTEDTKRAFAKQRQLYQADLARIAAEQAAAVEAGQMAATQVRALVSGQSPNPAPSTLLDRETAWQELWAGVGEEPPATGFLRDALHMATMLDVLGPPGLAPPVGAVPSGHGGSSGAVPAQGAVEMTAPVAPNPTGRDPLGTPAPMPVYAAHACRDPYFASPSARPVAASLDGAEGGAAVRHHSRPRPHPYGTTVGDEASAADLEARLAERRAAALAHQSGDVPGAATSVPLTGAASAMQAFGRPVKIANNLLAGATIEDDDDDLEGDGPGPGEAG